MGLNSRDFAHSEGPEQERCVIVQLASLLYAGCKRIRVLETTNYTLWSSDHECVSATHICGWSPPPYVNFVSTSRPPRVHLASTWHHAINETRPSPFFALFRFRVLYWTKTEAHKTGEAGDKANNYVYHCQLKSDEGQPLSIPDFEPFVKLIHCDSLISVTWQLTSTKLYCTDRA